MRSFAVLLKNELKLNIRNMNMVIFAVLLPLVVLVILGFLYGTSPAAGAAVPAGREGNPGDKLSLLVRHHFDHTVAAGFGAGTTVDTREIGGDLDHGVFLLG